ncbi:MAG: hypothetical protein WCY16_03890 [Weeksellaceae bacterium]
MADINESNQWEEGIYLIEESDVVRGGDPDTGGVSNIQGRQLANRTRYLYDRLGRLDDVLTINLTDSIALDYSFIKNKHVSIIPKNKGASVLLNPITFPDGACISITINSETGFQQGTNAVKIKPSEGAVIKDLNAVDYKVVDSNGGIYLYIGEMIRVVKKENTFYVLDIRANLDEVGEILHKARRPAYALEAKGQLVNRADYPRLWEWVKLGGALSGSSGIYVSDASWLMTGGEYTGMFSSGNGTTTFRMPDLRAQFIRSLDNGRSMDTGRMGYQEGSAESDSNKNHTHKMYNKKRNFPSSVIGEGTPVILPAIDGPAVVDNNQITGESGSGESRPKNIAFTAYIKY